MRKLSIVLVFFLALLLAGCSSEEEGTSFLIRKENYFISENDRVIIDYKTDENGELVQLSIDRLLGIDEMIFYNTEIDFEVTVPDFTGDVYTYAGSQCTDFDDLQVPINIEIGNTRYLYSRTACEYVEVNRDNEPKLGDFVRTYNLEDTIPVSKEVQVSVVVFNESSIERFIEVEALPHTMKMIGVYSIGINYEKDGFTTSIFNYNRDMRVVEQLIIKNQDYEVALGEAQGIPTDINLLEFDLNMDFEPLVDDLAQRYDLEISAIEELFSEIGVGFDEVEGTDNEEPVDEETPEEEE